MKDKDTLHMLYIILAVVYLVVTRGDELLNSYPILYMGGSSNDSLDASCEASKL